MNFPKLRDFIKDPSCVDKKAYGKKWINEQKYEERWEKFIKSFELDLKLKFFIEDESSYYVHILVPSGKMANTYDVVIRFFTEDDYVANESTLLNYNIQIFSNNPVFAFHFGYANFNSGLMIEFLANLLPRDILENKAEHYNPNSAVGFDNSFYFAAKYLLSKSRFLNKSWIEERSMKFTEKRVYRLVRPLDQTLDEYKHRVNRDKMLSKFKNNDSIKDKIGNKYDDAKGKINEFKDKVLDKLHTKKKSDSHRISKITAKKSIGKISSVRRIKARKR